MPRKIAVARFRDETDDILPPPHTMGNTELVAAMHIAHDEERKASIALHHRAEETLRKARIRAAKARVRLVDLDTEAVRRMRDDHQP